VIAALFVQRNGCYFGLPNVDPWDECRDARAYDGPYPIIAHPPCKRWSRYWYGGPNSRVRHRIGDDQGCFKAALEAVRKYGGVIEHPEASHAWLWFGIERPPKSGGWIRGDEWGHTCCVEQGHYGHAARKATWLYAVRTDLPRLAWGPSNKSVRVDGDGFQTAEKRRRAVRTGLCQRLSARQRSATPLPFRDLMISLAESVKQ
jgi:hypothetical protein